MLQEFNSNHNPNLSTASAELNWWRTWESSWWAHVYF
ncbi:Trp operon leader peptide [Vibrio fluvialis]|nr:Trp operon leader peptide [Vibrio fluvialis]EKO3434914.1 Trp operon leader peptide [Vibrio fluvialis]ELE2165399.1 Trp operon leader peptide [Vibrio fluvialis]MBY7798373.1 Trp operon leader peptide [Vibrio fluvialis]MBY7819077.1 Trp operon leader peptide [Vibrio fluvialis]MBY7844685.1 Trp operon leader peptide [Vibrio fluvialis]